VHDAVVEHRDGNSVVVLSAQPAAAGHELLVRFNAGSGPQTFAARVISTTFDSTHQSIRYRLTLSVASMASDEDVAEAPTI
jgi:hypothetical protein